MSPWRYKKTTEIMSVVSYLKLKQCWAHFVWPFSPLPLAKGERTKVRGWSPKTVGCPLIKPHSPLSLRKGEATRCTYRIPSA